LSRIFGPSKTGSLWMSKGLKWEQASLPDWFLFRMGVDPYDSSAHKVRWATNRCCPEGHKEASDATRAPPDRDDTVASDLRDEEEVIDEEAQIARHYGVDRPTIRAIIRPTADRFEHFFRPDIELQLARSSLRQEQREARAQRQRFFRLVRAA